MSTITPKIGSWYFVEYGHDLMRVRVDQIAPNGDAVCTVRSLGDKYDNECRRKYRAIDLISECDPPPAKPSPADVLAIAFLLAIGFCLGWGFALLCFIR